jgi:hypothetical protein
MSGIKTLASHKCSFTLHIAACLKPVSSVCTSSQDPLYLKGIEKTCCVYFHYEKCDGRFVTIKIKVSLLLLLLLLLLFILIT